MVDIDQSKCTFCAGCSSVCPAMAITVQNDKSFVAPHCASCGICVRFCPVDAITDSGNTPHGGL